MVRKIVGVLKMGLAFAPLAMTIGCFVSCPIFSSIAQKNKASIKNDFPNFEVVESLSESEQQQLNDRLKENEKYEIVCATTASAGCAGILASAFLYTKSKDGDTSPAGALIESAINDLTY